MINQILTQNKPKSNSLYGRAQTTTSNINKRSVLNKAVEEAAASETKTECSTSQKEESEERKISECADVINFILARAKCPADHRAFIDAVIGAAEGNLEWFEADDFAIGKRIRGGDNGIQPNAIKKIAQRGRKAFNEWQAQSGYLMIEAKRGGKRGGINYKTRYKVPLLLVAGEVLRSAVRNARWKIEPEKSIRDAVKPALQMLQGATKMRDEFTRPRQDDESILNRQINTILTNARKSIEIVKRNDGDAFGFVEKMKSDFDKLLRN